MNLPAVSIAVTIVLGLAGYLATYLNNLAMARRKERLELVSKRINEFYGPLYLSSKASAIAYQAFKLRLAGLPREAEAGAASDGDTPTMREWRLWVAEVLMPLNQEQERRILNSAHLILEQEVPDCLLKFLAHVAAWRAILKKWESGDFSEQFSVVAYPAELGDYAAVAFAKLKTEQLRLIGRG